jgi:hypothetical protein
MIKLKDILFEAKQVGVIYHYTSYNNAEGILKKGKLRSDMGGALGSLDDPYYSISFTRDKNFHKVARNLTYVGTNIPCRFTFDGDSMSNKYSFKPFAQKGFEKGKRRFESEERIVSKDVFDVPLDKYVISFDIIIEYKDQKEWTDDKLYYLDMKDCIKLCKEKNIKINTIDGNGDPIPPKEVKSFFQKVLSKLGLNEATISYKNDATKKKELGTGAHFVFSGRQKVGVFHVRDIGTIEFDPMDKIKQKGKGPSSPNTIFMYGGMAIMAYRQGIGKQVIQKIFKDNPNIQHIALYTSDQAIGFWNKLKGKVLGEKDGTYYMQIDRI